MTAVTWPQLLSAATAPDEVIATARDFVGNINHTRLAKLPEACKPGKLLDTHDIASYAYDLVRHRCEDNNDPEVAETIRELADFFAHAASRLSQLAAPSGTKDRQEARLFS